MISSEFPWATFGVVILTTVAAIVGGAVVIWGHDGALSFNQYLDYMWKFAAAVGVLGVGRGLKSGLENHGAVSSNLTDASLLTQLPGLLQGMGTGNGGSDSGDAPTSNAMPVEVIPHV